MRLPFTTLFPLTQQFGANPQYYSQFLVLYPDGTRKPMAGHNGLDFGCPHGTEVVAPHAGTIIEATFDQNGYGNYVKIENDQMGSVLAHLDRIDVQVGFKVAEGDHIGLSDNTGYSTGNHLHWGWYTIPRNRANGEAGFQDQTEALKAVGIHLTLGQNPVIDQPTNTEPQSGKLYTQAEYDAAMTQRNTFWQERDKAVQDLQDLQNKYDDLQRRYTVFTAAGYNTLDDITKALSGKDATILALQTEVAQVRDSNAKVHTLLATYETQDHTAADLGIQAQDKLKELQDGIGEIAKAADVEKPSVNVIVGQIFNWKDLAQRFIQKKEQEEKAKQQVSSPPQVKHDTGSMLLELLQIIPTSKGVK